MPTYFPTSALHPRLQSAEQQRALAEQWRDDGVMRIQNVLTPGLAAELALVCGDLPLKARLYEAHQDLSWSLDLGVPEKLDPQQPECLFRLMRFLQKDLPSLVNAITGRNLERAEARLAHLWSMRKGSFVDAGGPLAVRGGIDATLGLTGINWPTDWGGHLVWQSEGGQAYGLPPGFDTLDLFDGGRFVVPLVSRHVRSLVVRAHLNPAGGTP